MNKDRKSVIVLKNLPSNFIDEAIVVVKDKKKIKNPEYKVMQGSMTESEIGNVEKIKKENRSYVITEAELIIKGYIDKIENKNKQKDLDKIKKKNKKLEIVNYVLSIATFMSLIIAFVK